MIIEPKVIEYISTTAHPQGCAESVRHQAEYACKQGTVNGTKKALIIGCSTGYGLASRICALENCGADTLGIMFERQANGRRTATPGWYNTAEFHRLAAEKGAYAKTINGDAFSKEIKEKTIERIKKDLGKVDLVVYSLAAPRRTDAEGKTWSSCLKTTGEAFTEKSLDLRNNEITENNIGTEINNKLNKIFNLNKKSEKIEKMFKGNYEFKLLKKYKKIGKIILFILLISLILNIIFIIN